MVNFSDFLHLKVRKSKNFLRNENSNNDKKTKLNIEEEKKKKKGETLKEEDKKSEKIRVREINLNELKNRK